MSLTHTMDILEVNVAALLVAKMLAEQPQKPLWAYMIAKNLNIRPQRAGALLGGLERLGWAKGEMERADASRAGRPPRRLYRITEPGLQAVQPMLTKLRS